VVSRVLIGRQQCFADVQSRRQADVLSSFTTLKNVLHQLYEGLHQVVQTLLRQADTREAVLEFLADLIQKNAKREALQVISNSLFLIFQTQPLG
jgi:ubiquitin conjugation factor E4 B